MFLGDRNCQCHSVVERITDKPGYSVLYTLRVTVEGVEDAF